MGNTVAVQVDLNHVALRFCTACQPLAYGSRPLSSRITCWVLVCGKTSSATTRWQWCVFQNPKRRRKSADKNVVSITKGGIHFRKHEIDKRCKYPVYPFAYTAFHSQRLTTPAIRVIPCFLHVFLWYCMRREPGRKGGCTQGQAGCTEDYQERYFGCKTMR
jgi:hypothetical protein